MPLYHPSLHPGPPMPVIPHSRPAGGVMVDGPATAELERRWCELTGMTAACAAGSGTAALRLALLALGVGPGDEVIVPAYSCVALLNAPLAVGAVPVLADVLPGEWTLDPDDVQRRLTPNTRAIIAVNLFGMPAHTGALNWLGLPVIEDCAHGPIRGSTPASISSFYATKLVGAGMGGIVAAHDPRLIDHVRARRDYGDQLPDGRNLNDKIGEDDAKMAMLEIDVLPAARRARARLAPTYTSAITESPLRDAVSPPEAHGGRVWYRYVVETAEGLTAAPVVEWMQAAGVMAEKPVWDLRACPYWTNDLPVANGAFDRLISLPIYPGLTDEEQQRVIAALIGAIK